MMDALKHFEKVSGLRVNEDKSFCVGINGQILQLLNFREGTLPVKYLGLPLVSTFMSKDHYQNLVEKITIWTTKHLSYKRRVQLINVVLRNMHVYWCCVFILPKAVI